MFPNSNLRPRFLLALLALLISVPGLSSTSASASDRRPNVLVILTDDQGYGDLSLHGNPVIQTPNIDKLGRQGTQLRQFHVMPVCSPTRACLMTGRYFYRTGVVDTYIGRSMMHPDEVTLAEMLRDQGGYRTGIFGKWHLGDNYPLRPIDQGFDEALVHKGGGIGQPSDPPGGDHYFDPTLLKNGQAIKTRGYCSDVYTDAALEFIGKAAEKPFFAYVAFNAPHDPLEVAEDEVAPYRSKDLSPAAFPKVGNPLPAQFNPERIAKVYGMVTNIDRNVGRMLDLLDKKKLERDTIVIFFTDNGPAFARYNAGLRDVKGSVYEGGTRVACLIRWPAGFKGGGHVDVPAAPIDLAPTLLAACGVTAPATVKFDGRNLLPLLKGEITESAWPDRVLFTQWHRGDVPERGRAFAARSKRYKLVQAKAIDPKAKIDRAPQELYDIENDPYEQHNLASMHPEIVRELRKAYDNWFADVAATRNFAQPRIHVGTKHENPTLLTRQDWRVPPEGDPRAPGHWNVEFMAEGRYDYKVIFQPGREGRVDLVIDGSRISRPISKIDGFCEFRDIERPKGPGRIEGRVIRGENEVGPLYVEVRRQEK